MVFRPFAVAVAQPAQAERKPLAPSLLSDPAFSADPHSHPFSVTGHEPWLNSPPVGHPSLKSRKRRTRPILASDAKTIDSDTEPFHLIQPPNSPVNFPDPTQSPAFAIPKEPENKEEEGSQSSTASSSLNARSPAAPVEASQSPLPPPDQSSPPLQPPLQAKAERTSLMTFLTRRRTSQQPETSASFSNSKSKKASKPRVDLVAEYDVIRPLPPRQSTDPVLQHNVARPALSTRPATFGATTPVSTSAKGSKTSMRHAAEGPIARGQDLDRIDELDETNPWGAALHHGGPYEAAVKAIRPDQDASLAFGGPKYHQRAMQAHGNNYIPPEAPAGVSLGLSPGQILPRNFQAQYVQPVHNMPPPPSAAMMRPPIPQGPPLPSVSRRQTYQPDYGAPVQNFSALPSASSSRRQSYQPQAMTQMRDFQPLQTSSAPSHRQSHMAPSMHSMSNPYPMPPQHSASQMHQSVTPMSNPHALPPSAPSSRRQSHLAPSTSHSVNSQPSIPHPHRQSQFPPSSTPMNNPQLLPNPHPVRQEEPRSPPNRESLRPAAQNDLVSIGIGMAMLDDEDAEESDASVSAPSTPNITIVRPAIREETKDFDPYDRSHLEIAHPSRQVSPATVLHPEESGKVAPPPDTPNVQPTSGTSASAKYAEAFPAESRGDQEGLGSPPPYAPPLPEKNPLRLAHQQQTLDARQSQPSSRNSSPGRGLAKVSEENGSRESHRSEEGHRLLQRASMPVPAMVQTQPNPSQQLTPPASVAPSRRSPERMSLQSPPSSSFDDGRSMHPSISTYSSGQSRNMGPPPPRHIPRHLVMPAPLSQQPNLGPNPHRMSHQPSNTRMPQQPPPPPPSGQWPQYRAPPPGRSPLGVMSPPRAAGPPPMQPVQNIMRPQSHDAPPASKVGKLKKRVSVIGNSSSSSKPPPVITTVSFAPPIIGFDGSVANEKGLQRAMTEKVASAPKRVLSKRKSKW